MIPRRPTENRPAIFLPPSARDETIAEALVALANAKGGDVFFGISKSGKPQKFPNPAATRDRVLRVALLCDPPLIIPAPKIEHHDGHPVVVIHIPPDLPHVYNFDGRYLIYQNDEIVPLRGEALRSLIFARGESSFDGRVTPEAGRDALNWDAVRAYVAAVDALRHLSPEEALLKRGCLKDENGVLRPTNAGILLFGRDPQQFFPQAEITVARYTGIQMSDTFLRADIRGTLPEQARRAEAFIRENIAHSVEMNDHMQRAETSLYPLSAVREVIINALAHRDYSIRGDSIRLLLFANRLECYSPGRLPGHITIQNILEERFSRNAIIVQVLYDMGFIERLGYGIDRIVRSMAENGMPEPVFSETTAGFNITLHSRQPAGGQSVQSVRAWLEQGLNERQIKAMGFVADKGRITNADYQTLCPDVSPETLRRDLSDLVARDLLLRIGEKRATFYIQK